MCLNSRHCNFSHRRKPWLCKYLLHHYLQIFIQGRVLKKFLKNNGVYFLAICVNFPCKIDKFELEVVAMGILVQDFASRAAINISNREIPDKGVPSNSCLCLVSLKTLLLLSVITYIGRKG